MEKYVELVKNYPFISAMIQFAILGTLGEMIAIFIRKKSFKTGWSLWVFTGKVLAWAILGIIIKLGFTGMKGFAKAIMSVPNFPALLTHGIGKAFIISFLTNIFFGPQMMAFHRIEDNIIEGKKGFTGIEKAWATLIWFWIPAHTFTFSLPVHYQIGLAAVWGLVLGIIMGLTNKR